MQYIQRFLTPLSCTHSSLQSVHPLGLSHKHTVHKSGTIPELIHHALPASELSSHFYCAARPQDKESPSDLERGQQQEQKSKRDPGRKLSDLLLSGTKASLSRKTSSPTTSLSYTRVRSDQRTLRACWHCT